MLLDKVCYIGSNKISFHSKIEALGPTAISEDRSFWYYPMSNVISFKCARAGKR